MKTKLKTKKSLSRRVKITAGGKVLHGASFKRHLRRSKSSAQKRRYKQTTEFNQKLSKKIKQRMGV